MSTPTLQQSAERFAAGMEEAPATLDKLADAIEKFETQVLVKLLQAIRERPGANRRELENALRTSTEEISTVRLAVRELAVLFRTTGGHIAAEAKHIAAGAQLILDGDESG